MNPKRMLCMFGVPRGMLNLRLSWNLLYVKNIMGMVDVPRGVLRISWGMFSLPMGMNLRISWGMFSVPRGMLRLSWPLAMGYG